MAYLEVQALDLDRVVCLFFGRLGFLGGLLRGLALLLGGSLSAGFELFFAASICFCVLIDLLLLQRSEYTSTASWENGLLLLQHRDNRSCLGSSGGRIRLLRSRRRFRCAVGLGGVGLLLILRGLCRRLTARGFLSLESAHDGGGHTVESELKYGG